MLCKIAKGLKTVAAFHGENRAFEGVALPAQREASDWSVPVVRSPAGRCSPTTGRASPSFTRFASSHWAKRCPKNMAPAFRKNLVVAQGVVEVSVNERTLFTLDRGLDPVMPTSPPSRPGGQRAVAFLVITYRNAWIKYKKPDGNVNFSQASAPPGS